MREEFNPSPRDQEQAEAIAKAMSEALTGIGRCWVTVEVAIVESPVEWRANVAVSIEPLLPMTTPLEALTEFSESLRTWIERAKEKLR